MNANSFFTIILAAPLIGFLANGLRFKDRNHLLAGTLATVAAGTAFVAALFLYAQLLGLPAEQKILTVKYFDWIGFGDFNIAAEFMVDRISAVMLLVVTGVGSLIHLFSIGYMAGDDRPAKYFAYLNLFLFNMLLLILGANLPVMFVGWEGVGLCSYLLIGFWFQDVEKANAGMKAFVTNRIGDAGLLLGIFVIFSTLGTLDFQSLAAANIGIENSFGPITLACIFLFVGAMGKSAQIPLYVWLPDAMAGPTPVSALIHAATMVTAGVYMIARLSNLFVAAPDAMMLVAVVGATTAVFAAAIGLTQWDIKKVLAYSTVSQLGYMFLGVGVGAFSAGMFHLVTHAFFKALMFLGAGSVIHGMHHEQDMRKMGGLAKKMPITHATFLVGWIAIIGVPPFSGFFSKDEILWQAFHSPRGHWTLWLMGVIGAVMTAFYMTRLMALTFWTESRVTKDVHPHESPLTMTIPLIVLAGFAAFAGFLGIPHVMSHTFHLPDNIFHHWLEPALAAIPNEIPGNALVEWGLMGMSVSLAALSAGVAYKGYVKKQIDLEKLVGAIEPLRKASENKFWVDEIYFAGIINPVVRISRELWQRFDVGVVDRMTYLASDAIREIGGTIRQLQTGNLQIYALYLILGMAGVLLLI